MKKMNPVVRVILQLLLVAPVLTFFPYAVLMGLGGFLFDTSLGIGNSIFEGKFREAFWDFGYSVGWLGQIGLVLSIVVPKETFQRIHWARILETLLLALGLVATAALLSSGTNISLAKDYSWWPYWLWGGPVAVAFWNLYRIYQKVPLQVQPAPASRAAAPDS